MNDDHANVVWARPDFDETLNHGTCQLRGSEPRQPRDGASVSVSQTARATEERVLGEAVSGGGSGRGELQTQD